MKRISIILTILFSILLTYNLRIEAQLFDSITKTHYYNEEIFDIAYLNIYNSWDLIGISGGFSGEGYEPDFDNLKVDSFGIFRIYRNDSLFIYGKITIDEQTPDHLLITFDADTITGGILFGDMEKFVRIDSNSLVLEAPCCDRYNYHFVSDNQNPFVHIPDTAFLYALIDEEVDTNGDSLISYEEAEVVKSLEIHSPDNWIITDLAGINAFKNLKKLQCTHMPLVNLDVSKNTALTDLACDACGLENLDISGNSELINLDVGQCYRGCYLNQLTELDISNCPRLNRLIINGNPLLDLDVSNNSMLTVLECGACGLSTLEVSNCTDLTDLHCSGNQFSNLDVSNNFALRVLYCPMNNLTSLDVSNNISLVELSCWDNQISNLDLSNNELLVRLDCSANNLAGMDLRNNFFLEYLALRNMPTLQEVCVWKNFDLQSYALDTTGSPNVYFSAECATGIKEKAMTNIWIYPNPTNTILTIEIGNSDIYSIEITSLNGQNILSTEKEGTTHQFDFSSFQSGVYFITIRSEDFVTTRKFVKL